MSSLLFFTRFLQRPGQVASIIPSSPMMRRRVSSKMDLSRPCVVAEYGPGEGCHTREWLSRAHPDSKFLLFELDPELSRDLERQFANDKRVTVINADCATLSQELVKHGVTHCDYIISGIPFSTMEVGKKRQILRNTYEALKPGGEFIIYQVTNELRRHATPDIFPRATSEYFIPNVPPMFITVFHKDGAGAPLNANGSSNGNGNGNGSHAKHAKNGKRNGQKRSLAADGAAR